MFDSTKTLVQQAVERIKASEARCDAAQEKLRHTDHHITTSREAINRSQDRVAKLTARSDGFAK